MFRDALDGYETLLLQYQCSSYHYFARFAFVGGVDADRTLRVALVTPVTSTSLRKVLNFNPGDAAQPQPLLATTLTSYSVFGVSLGRRAINFVNRHHFDL